MDIPDDIGQRLKRGRELKAKRLGKKRLTLVEVEGMVGLSNATLSRIENGKHNPPLNTLIALAKLYENDFGVPELSKYLIKHQGAAEIPLVGRVAAGKPIQVYDEMETLYVPAQMLSAREGETFAVQVSGDSMMNVGIRDKDIIVLHKVADSPADGTVVVARIGFGESAEYTLKSFYRNGGTSILLMPENDDYDKIILEPNITEIHVEGKFAGLIRFGN